MFILCAYLTSLLAAYTMKKKYMPQLTDRKIFLRSGILTVVFLIFLAFYTFVIYPKAYELVNYFGYFTLPSGDGDNVIITILVASGIFFSILTLYATMYGVLKRTEQGNYKKISQEIVKYFMIYLLLLSLLLVLIIQNI